MEIILVLDRFKCILWIIFRYTIARDLISLFLFIKSLLHLLALFPKSLDLGVILVFDIRGI